MIRDKFIKSIDSGNGILESMWGAVWGDATIEDKRRFFRILFRVAIAVHILWACGVLQQFGLFGFAWASDVEKKIEAVTKAIEKDHTELLIPVNKRLDELSKSVEDNQALVKKLLVVQLSGQIRDLNRLRCSTSDPATRARFEADIEEAQASYRVLTGDRYPLVYCRDL